MSTDVDGAPPAVAPEPEDGPGAGSTWLQEEMRRRMAAAARGSGGRHARRGAPAPVDPAPDEEYAPRHLTAAPNGTGQATGTPRADRGVPPSAPRSAVDEAWTGPTPWGGAPPPPAPPPSARPSHAPPATAGLTAASPTAATPVSVPPPSATFPAAPPTTGAPPDPLSVPPVTPWPSFSDGAAARPGPRGLDEERTTPSRRSARPRPTPTAHPAGPVVGPASPTLPGVPAHTPLDGLPTDTPPATGDRPGGRAADPPPAAGLSGATAPGLPALTPVAEGRAALTAPGLPAVTPRAAPRPGPGAATVEGPGSPSWPGVAARPRPIRPSAATAARLLKPPPDLDDEDDDDLDDLDLGDLGPGPDGEDRVLWRAAPAAEEDAPEAPAPPRAEPQRVRVVLSERKTVARPVRNVVELQESGAVGDLLRKNLIGSQLTVALRFAVLGGGLLAALPLLFWLYPAIGRLEILGFRVPWIVLGVLVYPFLFGLGWWFTRSAERVEQNFANQVQD